MISDGLSLSDRTLEKARERIKTPVQEPDFITMKADAFFKWLEECNAKKPLPNEFKVKPIKYDLEEKMQDSTPDLKDMTDEQIQSIFDNDKHSAIEDDPLKIEKLVYGMFQLNDLLMDFLRLLTIELKGMDLYHRDIKQKLKELRKLIHENHTKKLKDGQCWGGRSEEDLDAIASDNSVVTALMMKFVGLSRKITFFGGLNASIGQKVWAIHPNTNKLVLVRIDSAQGIVECRDDGTNIGNIILRCTRLNEKTGNETKDCFEVDSVNMFYTKDEGQGYLAKQSIQ